MKLEPRYIEKPWGRTELPGIFKAPSEGRVGEIAFGAGSNVPLLAKYLFTSEKLSVQVHPDDGQARQRGQARGKAECWYVIDAEPGATIGLGLRRPLSREQLSKSALDGSIVDELSWRPVRAGDFFFIPPGTIHAIGGGISLLEFQQNSNITYRLYDYGRPRELHVEEAVSVATADVYPEGLFQRIEGDEERIVIDADQFTLIHGCSDQLEHRQRWALPLEGTVRCNGDTAGAGECLLVGAGEKLAVNDARLFIGAAR